MNLLSKLQTVDILAIGVHPDDVELSCSGTLLAHIKRGYSVGLLDLTLGELGTRGNAALRTEEAMQAAEKLGASFRIQLDLPDGFFEWSYSEIIKIISVVREAKPKLVFTNALSDRHPDHGRAAKLTADALFYSGLQKIVTLDSNGESQIRWRPEKLLHYIQDHQLKADIVFDITDYMDQKIEIIKCFKSQFYDPNSKELNSPISGEDFFEYLKAKAKIYGRSIQVRYAEGFNTTGPYEVKDLMH
ncbi:MAG: bacillithiol biosynthesis deacetylase BshB1 [Saprospiraceae bacterium]|nr:bacillithiol biosynthesis deacetylase BshB1 [Saprospiraceae bacterium]